MKIAIITITEDAQRLAESLEEKFNNDSTIISVKIFHKNVKTALRETFQEYDCLLGIMATGIMIRNICPLIKNKIEDPAVLAMDDKGKHVISLLSGHFGGANDITLKISEITGAEPVITTATDVHGKLGIDSLAIKYHLHTEDHGNIKAINSALINNEKVDLYIPAKYEFIFKDKRVKTSYIKKKSLNNKLKAVYEDYSVILRSKKLVMGIGARKGVGESKVHKAINEVMKFLNLSPMRVDALATGEMKEEEEGIIQAAKKLNIPLEIISIDQIKSLNHPHVSSSKFVEKKFGIPGVSEPTALIAAGDNSRLIFKKTAFNGVTVAIAVSYN